MCNGHIKYSVLPSVNPEMQVFVLHSFCKKKKRKKKESGIGASLLQTVTSQEVKKRRME